jgi:general secretion pathway protein D
MRTMLIVTCASVLSAALCGPRSVAFGQSSSSTGSAAERAERLNREDVDKLLAQARAAIQAGKLDEADTLVRRAERAGIRYPFMHLGATPTSVRRELNDARKESGASKGTKSALPSTSQRPSAANGTVSDASNPANDPFLRTETALNRSTTSNSPTRGDTPRQEARGASIYASDQLDQAQPLRQPIVQASYGDDAPIQSPDAINLNAPPRTGAGAFSSDSIASAKSSWALPDAPLPRAQSVDRSTAGISAQRTSASAKEETLARLRAAREAMQAGNFDLAEQLVREASALGVPESSFLPNEDRPSLVAGDLQRIQFASSRSGQGVVRADLTRPSGADRYASQAGPAINPYSQPSGLPVQATSPIPPTNNPRLSLLPDPIELPADYPASANPLPISLDHAQALEQSASNSDALRLLREGEAALRRRDRQAASELFGQAHILRDQLTPADRQRLQDHLQMTAAKPTDGVAPAAINSKSLQATGATVQTQATGGPLPRPGDFIQSDLTPVPLNAAVSQAAPATDDLLESADAKSQVLARQLQAEVGRAQTEARRLMQTQPKEALDLLNATRQKVTDAQLSSDIRNQLFSRLDVTLENTQQYIEEHRSELELDDRNKAVLAQIDREREVKSKVRHRIGEMVEEFNRLRDEQRYAEMEVVARRLYEMAPDDPVVQQVYTTAKFIRREIMNRQLADLKEESIFSQLHAADEAAINPVARDGHEVAVDAKYWDQFVRGRKGSGDRSPRSERELEIERRMKTPVRVNYNETPLSQVTQELSQLAGVNIHLDPRGLNQEGVQTDTPVTLSLNTDISLKSALSLILTPLHLSYVIKDEVLQITSDQISKGELVIHTYYVADLVTPIPNFVPNANMGLQGMLNDAYSAMGRGPNGLGPMGPGVIVDQNRGGIPGAASNGNTLAQQIPMSSNIPGAMQPVIPVGSGPGGLGGGANADFDSLIDLIVSTVEPDSWAEGGGGTAEVRPFPTNLSLVISQTQAIHEEIADLLEQLRRLQDLQITIECRFIRLNDSFFERIGIDFDMNIEDRTIGTADLLPGTPFEGGRQTAIVGMTVPTGVNDFPRFTSDLDVPIRQNSFELTALPPFGAPADVARFGFAILSDIEAYFLIEAAQGDRRTNVLNAPKVTLFNGQQATIVDNVQTPFVVSVVPVVGEFVAASQPVIVVLNEGTSLTIQAVASDDRRYVRLTVVPNFTQIGEVRTFTFEGSSTSTSSSSSTDDDEDGKNEQKDEEKEDATSGTTVQQPSFQTLQVTTTVSVPDGGTVLLGGIKRMSEGRNEFGVPLLSKLPYVNRLFRNVAIGRETDSLMMMVTPRIIIQEEEEERLGIDVTQ